MKFLMLVLALGVSSVAADDAFAQCAAGRASRALEVGDEAPPFSMPGSDGRTYRLSDYRGKQAVVLAWFARAFSAG